jgi:hypothetical protein
MLVKVGDMTADVRVHAVMSTPRSGFTDNFSVWAQAFIPLGIPVTNHTGAFWSQGIQKAIEKVIDDCQYVITVDYDTFFTKRDVEALMTLSMAYHCDAITGLQVKRDSGLPMITMLGCDDNPPESGKTTVSRDWFSKPIQQVDAMHFGCTVISTAALKRTPKPWFQELADSSGEWGKGKTDADMFFWRQFRKAGNRAYVTPRVLLGHGEYRILWPNQQMNGPIYQNPADFVNNDGKRPQECWITPSTTEA